MKTTFLGHIISHPRYIPLTSWLRHGPFAMWLISAARPKLIVELGSHYAYSYFAFCQAVKENGLRTRCVAVDTWAGDEHAGHYGEEVYQAVLAENAQYEGFSTLLRKTFAEALDDFEDGSVDMLHVDGRHFYDDVKEDFESWIPKLAENAVVLFHDTMVHERGFGVWRYWKELEDSYPTFNFRYQHGLGVLFRGSDLTPEMAEFRQMAMDTTLREEIHRQFSAQGEALAEAQAGTALAADVATDSVIMALKTSTLTGLSRLSESNQMFGEVSTALHATNLTLDNVRGELKATREALNGATAERDVLSRDLQALSVQHDSLVLTLAQVQQMLQQTRTEEMHLRNKLATTRLHPRRAWRDLVSYTVLSRLVKSGLPLSEKTRARFARSASKRNPKRSLKGEVAPDVQDAMPLGNALSVLEGRLPRQAGRRNVMVVTHEATGTGAPILAHNIARVLSDRYNVTLLSLRGGNIINALYDVACEVLVTNSPPQAGDAAWNALGEFLAKRPMAFATANSLESRYVLPLFFELDIPSVALIHEFASFFPEPEAAFYMVMNHADHVVFSSRLTFDDAAVGASVEMASKIHVMPQGKCIVPREEMAGEANVDTVERQSLKEHLRPAGLNDCFLVIGAGYVQRRKGCDFFIEVARYAIARAAEEAGGRKLRFAWIGDGFDETGHDPAYILALKDQLRRAGMSDDVVFLPSTSEIDYAYELADMLMLPSRLDPLPNVAIDAMVQGLPVLSFDRATGISLVLEDAGLGEACVADYLDTADMGNKLLALAQSREHYVRVSDAIRIHAKPLFDMERYVGDIEALAMATQERNAGRAADIETITAEERFEPRYVLGPTSDASDRKAAARLYLERLSRATVARRPEPGFHPHLFARHLTEVSGAPLNTDPYAEFLRQGRPEGPWNLTVIRDTADASLTEAAQALRVALQIHAYYVDELPQLVDRILLNQSRPALFISVPNSEAAATARQLLKRYDGAATVRITPNIGRDIAPLLTGFGRELVDGFDIVGHVHTKKSLSLNMGQVIKLWTRFLFENLLGGKEGGPMLDRTLNAMAADPGIGLVFPSDPNVLSWSRNREHPLRIADRLGIETLPELFDFPVGTMFWMRAGALKPFVDLGFDWSDYPREPIADDNTPLHALERLFGIHPVVQDYRLAVQHVTGVTR